MQHEIITKVIEKAGERRETDAFPAFEAPVDTMPRLAGKVGHAEAADI